MVRSPLRVLLAAATVAPMTAPAPAPDEIARLDLAGRPPALDGIIGHDEWAGAGEIPMRDGWRLLFKLCDDALYLAVRGPQDAPTVVTVALAYPDHVRTLHVSYSLGAALYRRTDPAGSKPWDRVHPFGWDAATGIEDPAGAAARRAHLDRHGWTATPIEVGRRGHFEFRLTRPLHRWTRAVPPDEGGGLELRFAVAVLDLDRNRLAAAHPADLRDGVTDDRLQRGDAPPSLGFEPARWGRVRWRAPEKVVDERAAERAARSPRPAERE